MINHIELAEEKLQQFLPHLKEIYPEGRTNKLVLKELVTIYQDMVFNDNVIVGLYDEPNGNFFFLSNNFQKIAGYKPNTIFNWGNLLLFKAIHYSHYSYPFITYKLSKKHAENYGMAQLQKFQLTCGGLKLVHKDGSIRRAFLKMKPLVWNKNNKPDITIIFVEDVTHLMKGENYWLRYASDSISNAYVRQKGKKYFNDLVSDSELKILKLLAKKRSTAEIADELFLSKLTVETHRKNMIKRVGAVNSTALVHLCKMANVI